MYGAEVFRYATPSAARKPAPIREEVVSRRLENRSAGLSRVDVLVILASAFVVLYIIYEEVVDSRDRTARLSIEESVREGNASQVKRGLKTRILVDMSIYEPWIDAEGKDTTLQCSLLSLAVKLRRPGVVEVLLEEGANVDGQVWGNARQPIFWAAYNDDEEMFEKLIGAGADPGALVEGKTALQYASERHEEAEEFLKSRVGESSSSE